MVGCLLNSTGSKDKGTGSRNSSCAPSPEKNKSSSARNNVVDVSDDDILGGNEDDETTEVE